MGIEASRTWPLASMRHCEPFGWPCCASWNVWLVTAPTPASPVPPTLRRVAAIAHNGGRGHRSAPSQGHRPRLGVLALRRSPCTLAHSAAPCGWGLAHAYAPAYAHVQHAERLAGCCTCPTTEKTVCEPHSQDPLISTPKMERASAQSTVLLSSAACPLQRPPRGSGKKGWIS